MNIQSKKVIFWIKKISEITEEQYQKYQYYAKLYQEAGYEVFPQEIKDFKDSLWSNSTIHVGGHGEPMQDCFDIFAINENNGSILPGLKKEEKPSYPILSKKEEYHNTNKIELVAIGTDKVHTLYLVDNGSWTPLKKINLSAQDIPLHKTQTDALEKGVAGTIVRVGFSKSYMVYRINESKDHKSGNSTKTLNFQYMV